MEGDVLKTSLFTDQRDHIPGTTTGLWLRE
jgi:hypothetical protein